jgi:RNA polymerase sigma-70 factor (ECF subfamily)
MDQRELGQLIRSFTRHLSAKQKMVFVLCDLQGLSHDEVSDITGMVKPSIKSNLNHARKKIRHMLTKYME